MARTKAVEAPSRHFLQWFFGVLLFLGSVALMSACTTAQNGPNPTPAAIENPAPTVAPTSVATPMPSPTPTATLTPTPQPTPRVRPTSTPSPTPTPTPMIPIAKGTVWTLREDFPENPRQRSVFNEARDQVSATMFKAIQPDTWYFYPSENGTFRGGPAEVISDGNIWFSNWVDMTREISPEGTRDRGTYRVFYSLEAGKEGSWVELPPPPEYGPTYKLALRGFYGRDGTRVFNEDSYARFVIFATPGDKTLGNTGTIYETTIVKP